ncbi:hypothetical protein ACFX13_019156 [Malus domestica]
MVVANSCPMEKRAQSKPSKASTAMPATATEKKLKDFEVCLDVRKLEIEIELNSKRPSRGFVNTLEPPSSCIVVAIRWTERKYLD